MDVSSTVYNYASLPMTPLGYHGEMNTSASNKAQNQLSNPPKNVPHQVMWSHLHWKSLIEAHSIIKPWKGQCGLFCKTLHLPTPVGVNQSKPHPKVCKLSWVVWLRPSEAISLQIMMTRIVLNSFYTCLLKLKCKLFELVYICWIFRSFSSFLHLLVTSNLAVQSAREEFNDMTFIQS